MPEWINAKDRMPVKYGLYFVKIGGNKELLRLHEIEKKLEWDYDVLWLDESDLAQKLTKELATAKSIEDMVKIRYQNPHADLVEKPNRKTLAGIVVSRIKEGEEMKEDHLKYLENLFGVKRAAKIANKSKKLK